MTLIELLVVVAVIGMISALLFPSFRSSREAARLGASKHFASSMDNALGGSPWGWYDFFDCSGSTVSDRSGNVNHLLFPGGANNPTWDTENPYSGENSNCSLSFDGISRYVQAVNSATPLSSSFTISVWVKPSDISGSIGILGTRYPSGSGQNAYSIELVNGGQIHSQIGSGSGWLNQNADATFTYEAGKWYQISEVVKPGSFTIYANAKVVGEGTINAGTPLFMDSTRRFRLGTIDSTDYFKGKIASLHIFPAALAAGDIEKLYAAERGAFVAEN